MKRVVTLLIVTCLLAGSFAQAESKAKYDVGKTYPSDAGAFTGDWKGQWSQGEKFPDIGAQVFPLGDGQYQVNLTPKNYMRTPPFAIVVATERKGQLTFDDGNYFGLIKNGKFTGGRHGDGARFSMEKYELVSPTMGAKPPKGAIVLFDGKNFDQWAKLGQGKEWTLLDTGVMMSNPEGGSLITNKAFKDVKVHLEFRTPLLPDARGQARGNSGVKLQKKFEVQVLDSYGLGGYWNECGAIYKVSAPYVNMCAPPLQWQTYDIIFRAPRVNDAGKVIENPRMTVRHNGVYVQRAHEIPIGAPEESKEAKSQATAIEGPLLLQTHGNMVQYRNIWVVEL